MSTTKPRIGVTVDRGLYNTITRLSQLRGLSRSGVIVDLLKTVEPSLKRTIAAFESASTSTPKLDDDAENEGRKVLRRSGETIYELERFLDGLELRK